MFVKVDKDEFDATLSYLEHFGEIKMFTDYYNEQSVFTEYYLRGKIVAEQSEQEGDIVYEINPDLYASYRLRLRNLISL